MVYFDFKKPPRSDPVAGTRGGEGIEELMQWMADMMKPAYQSILNASLPNNLDV